MPRRSAAVLFAFVLMVATGCDDSALRRVEAATPDTTAAAERARQDSIVRSSPGYVVDSILPIEEEIRRFRANLGDAPRGFSSGGASRSALVEAFVTAVERNDTTGLARLVVNRREFAYLVYPTSAHTRPPYRQSPQIVWLHRSAATNKGASRLFDRFGGRPVRMVGFTCAARALDEGENRIWEDCVVKLESATGGAVTLRMFGPIVERGGRFKFLSLANAL